MAQLFLQHSFYNHKKVIEKNQRDKINLAAVSA